MAWLQRECSAIVTLGRCPIAELLACMRGDNERWPGVCADGDRATGKLPCVLEATQSISQRRGVLVALRIRRIDRDRPMVTGNGLPWII